MRYSFAQTEFQERASVQECARLCHRCRLRARLGRASNRLNTSGPFRAKRKKIDAMQVTETLAEGLKHEFKISVPASDIDAKIDARLADMKDKVKLNGFRPGKVPVAHLKKVFGRSVAAETVDQLIRDTNTGIFTERGFRLAGEPKVTMPTEEKEIEDVLSGKSDLNYSVAIEVVPPIALADFKTFTVEKPVADVTDADVDEASSASPTRAALMPQRPKARNPRTATASPYRSRAPSTACRSMAARARASRS